MCTKVAVLLDGGVVLHKLYQRLGKKHPTADDVVGFAHACVIRQREELFRIYYYDCSPFGEVKQNPISKAPVDFKASATYTRQTTLLRELSLKDHVAFRPGELSFDGWALSRRATTALIKNPARQVSAADLVGNFRQKRVDMKIGLDIAWLASKRIVDRLLLVTGDSDFVPAMKFARREGVQIVLVHLGHQNVKRDLLIHTDEVREVVYPPAPSTATAPPAPPSP